VDNGGDDRGALSAVGLSCVACGVPLGATAKFCSECGRPATHATQLAEYKQVTVLFADVVHSMDLAVTVGAERLREIVTELVERSAAVVTRYGGTVDKFTGDGIMAVFGAPMALEDHAVRACHAAMGVQDTAKRLAADVRARDGVELLLRVGLNSGEVIVGEIGSGPLGYTAIGEQVGMAQRMESVAPHGGVMLSASTARLVDDVAALGEPELLQIKGAVERVSARRLLGMAERQRAAARDESSLVGRQWEKAAVDGLLHRAIDGYGAVVGVVGPPGIGKSRLAREVAAVACNRGVEVFTTFCESHTTEVPFHAVARLLRAATGVEGLDGHSARERVHDRVPDADPEDLVLFDDLLGIADPDVPLPAIDPDARRRRLTALVSAAMLGREAPAVYVIEDTHWIDEASESLIADLLAVIPQTCSLVVFTCRPEYQGALTRLAGSQTVALAPLSVSESAALVSELLGSDPTVEELGRTIVGKAAGNPFFAEEIVRELAERDVLRGTPGAYESSADVADVIVPATLQATIAARIDRLDPKAKRTLNAAAVIGSRFGLSLLTTLVVEPVVDDLLAAQLIDQVAFTRQPEYVFHHPLIRAVAYEAQLKSDRAELHRRVATAMEMRDPSSLDENAALIAGHLEAAGELGAAFDWHMRAAAWSTNRDNAAAVLSWGRASRVADGLRDEHPDRLAMRIAPRTLLCGNAWRAGIGISGAPFEELRELSAASGDKASLAVGMAGLLMEQTIAGRLGEASRLADELMALLEAIDDPALTVGMSFAAIVLKHETGDPGDILRWAQRMIDLADGDPAMGGNVVLGSPLTAAWAWRGVARWCFGDRGWREDFDEATAVAQGADAMAWATVVTYKYGLAIPMGVLLADDDALAEINATVQKVERLGDDFALALLTATLGIAIVYGEPAGRDAGLRIQAHMRQECLERRFTMTQVPAFDMYAASERARRGDYDEALPPLRAAVASLFTAGQLMWCIPGTCVLVERLLERGTEDDLAEADAAIERLLAVPADDGFVALDVMVLRLRALLAHARGEEAAYRDYRDRYRAMAASLGFEGHMEWAMAMP
jgi:class 3 adenylate cyclase